MKIVTIIGARPQFVKASVVSRAVRARGIQEILVNTGQHYDPEMSRIFFEEMGIPEPDYNLGVGSGTQGVQTGLSLMRIEEVLLENRPDAVLVYGDTNATIAGTLAAVKLHIPLLHVEAGLRSYNRNMPEEINRVTTDVLADVLYCPTRQAVENLKLEGITEGVRLVGDVMVDSLQYYSRLSAGKINLAGISGLTSDQPFGLLTIHRPRNADHPERLKQILSRIDEGGLPMVFPVHPRVRSHIEKLAATTAFKNIHFRSPVGYLEMLALEQGAELIMTDSGGVQKEAYIQKKPCITLRAETEWIETVEDGWNILVGDDFEQLPEMISHFPEPKRWKAHYGDGKASERIAVDIMKLGEVDQVLIFL